MRWFVNLSTVLVITFISNICYAQAAFGNWSVGRLDADEGYYAATMNDSNGVFGQYCYFESDVCVWLLATDVDCKEGSKYPALVNADGGSEQLELICKKLGAKPRYLFSNFDKIDAITNISKTYLGIAFPLESGLFHVTRFLLDGSQDAIQNMHSKINQKRKSKNSKGTKNYKM
jgi:hypothetical protein